MTIKHRNGRTSEALILARTERSMRVAIEGGDDSVELMEVDGAWFFEGIEPVQLEFIWQKNPRPAAPEANDCVCSADLAAKLVDLLYARARSPQVAAQLHLTAGSSLVS